jgi:uncharacterized protein
LISADLPWRQRELAYESAFPQSTQAILAVVDAPTPELADAAATALADQLSRQDEPFRSVEELGGGGFSSARRCYSSTSRISTPP